MGVKAAFTYIGETSNGLTKDRQYPAFELGGTLTTVNDDGCLTAVGTGSGAWRLDGMSVDDTAVYERKQPEDEGEKGEVDGKSKPGGKRPKGGNTAPTEEGGKAGGQNREGGEGGTDQR